jgi:hypothetical protein
MEPEGSLPYSQGPTFQLHLPALCKDYINFGMNERKEDKKEKM